MNSTSPSPAKPVHGQEYIVPQHDVAPPEVRRPNFIVSFHHVAPEDAYVYSPADRMELPVTIFFAFNRHFGMSDEKWEKLRSLVSGSPDTFGNLHTYSSSDGDPDASMMAFPRNIVWKSLPFTSKAKVSHAFTQQTVRETDIDGYGDLSEREIVKRLRAEDDAVVSSTSQVIVPAIMKDSPRLSKLLAVWDDRPAGLGVRLWFFDGRSLHPAPEGYVDDLRSRFRVEDHFLWNWRLNWTMLCSRALAKVSSDACDLRGFYEACAPSLDKSHRALSSPLAMIVMYGLRRRGKLGDPEDEIFHKDDTIRRRRNAKAVVSTSFVRQTEEGGSVDLRYDGTGRFPAITAANLKLRQKKFESLDPRWPLQFEDMEDVVHTLRLWRLAALDENGDLLLTKKGRDFLHIVGTSLDDPDVLLRWRDPESGAWPDDAVPAIDRWLHRAFRAVKRRVSGLPSSPKVEIPPLPRARYEDTRHRVIYGAIKRIPKAMLSTPDVARRIAEIEALTSSLPFKDRRFGIGRSSRCMGYDDTPFIFWAGVPVAILSSPELTWRTAGPLVGQSDVDAEVGAILSEAGCLWEGDWDCRPEFLAIELSEEPRTRFIATSDPWNCPQGGIFATEDDRERKKTRPPIYELVPLAGRTI